MGLIVYMVEFTSKFFLFGAIVYFLYRVFANGNRKDEVLLGAAYVTGFEVFSRMTGGAFTYEFAKYGVILFLLIGMFFRGFNTKSWPYLIFILLLIPGIFFATLNLNYETNVANAVGFNLSGPICLAISALYCYNRKMKIERLHGILLAALLPIISMTVYLYVFTPNIRDVLTGTQSNFETSGGFGPNQVATVLGLGMFILFARLILIKSRLINIIDLILLIFVSYRGIVTFSRGGVITAVIIAAVFFLIYLFHSHAKERGSLIAKIAFIGIVISITWVFTSVSTEGLIDKRYANQDASGRAKEDLTTGRAALINTELEAFYDNPITGVGVGKMKEYRFEQTGRLSASHNEMTRILSEHGLFGLFGMIILIFTPLVFRLSNKSNIYLFSFFLFWLLTINHSSMRIAAPAFIYGLCLISIIYVEKPAIHR